MADAYSTLLIERHADGYAVVTLNRPEALNALNSTLFGELAAFLDAVEGDDSVRCLVLTGSAKAFAAGADIKEMADQSYADMFKGNFFALGHDRITRFRKPIIAAMDMILTARMMDAAEAERAGLVSRVVAPDALLDEARAAAAKIASQSPLAVMMNKEMVNVALETTLTEGVRFERRLFHSLFAFDDQKEGMSAFVEKRKPDFKGR